MTSIEQCNLTTHLCVPADQPAQKTEVALYFMGQFHKKLNLSYETVQSIMKQLTVNSDSSLIVKLRGLWMLEKCSRSTKLFKENRDQKLQELFQPLAEYYCTCTEFVLSYQSLLTVHSFLNQIKLKELYPNNWRTILDTITSTVLQFIAAEFCNQDTVHVPIEALTFLAKIDEEATRQTTL